MIFLHFIFIFLVLLQVTVNAGTIDDLRKKVGYESPIHSERETDYFSISIPELKANSKKYQGKLISFECTFIKLETSHVDHSKTNRKYRFRRSADKYINFSAKDINQNIKLKHLYYLKNEEKENILYKLKSGTKMLIYGKVIDDISGKVFIDVYNFKIS